MATARVLHHDDDRDPRNQNAQNITIDSTGTPTPQAPIVTVSQPVTFINNSGQTINITFGTIKSPSKPTVFTNIVGLSATPPNNTDTQAAQTDNQTVNYMVQVGNNAPNGPFAIQVDNGPFYIQVIWDSTKNNGQCDPGSAMIPVGGTLQIYSGDTTTYNVGWLPNDPFTPALGQVVPGIISRNTGSANPNIVAGSTFTYTVSKPGPGGQKGNGGGTVKLG